MTQVFRVRCVECGNVENVVSADHPEQSGRTCRCGGDVEVVRS